MVHGHSLCGKLTRIHEISHRPSGGNGGCRIFKRVLREHKTTEIHGRRASALFHPRLVYAHFLIMAHQSSLSGIVTHLRGGHIKQECATWRVTKTTLSV